MLLFMLSWSGHEINLIYLLILSSKITADVNALRFVNDRCFKRANPFGYKIIFEYLSYMWLFEIFPLQLWIFTMLMLMSWVSYEYIRFIFALNWIWPCVSLIVGVIFWLAARVGARFLHLLVILMNCQMSRSSILVFNMQVSMIGEVQRSIGSTRLYFLLMNTGLTVI